MNILIIAPHMDDEVLGCGGTIVRHVEAGDHVTVCIVANRAYDHIYDDAKIAREKDACRAAKAVLDYEALTFLDLPDERLDDRQIDVIVPIETVVQQARPDVVYIPHRGDLNQDHRSVFDAARVAFRPHAAHRVRCVRVFEVPSSTDQVTTISEWPFAPALYVDIASTLDRKLEAMRCYEAESRPFPNPRSPEGLTAYARKRGMEVAVAAAEAFMVLRDLWVGSAPVH